MRKFALTTLLAIAATGVIAQQHPHGMPPGQAKKMQAQAQAQAPAKAVPAAATPVCHDCGTVQEVKMQTRKGEGGAVGIVAGAAAGGLLGNQFGSGNGKTALTVAGAVGGGIVGNEVQKRVTSKDVWTTKVKMRDGSVRTFEQEAKPAWKEGATVRVQGSNVSLHAGS